ncbi:MAG: hypothetical protein R2795_22255 [Saprospiraceae bacterium]
MSENPLEKFWKQVCDDIETILGWPHPSTWKKKDHGFGKFMENKLKERCSSNPDLLQRCAKKGNFKSGKSDDNIYKCFTPLKYAVKTPYLLEEFAVILGFDSCEAYCEARGLEIPVPEIKNKKVVHETQKTSVYELIKQHNKINFGEIISFNSRYGLEEIFIDPTFFDEKRRTTHNTPELLLMPSTKVLVHADSFTGKTTLLRFLASRNDSNVKLFIPLYKYKGSLQELILDSYNLSEEAYTFLRQTPSLILLLDAFDEIESEDLRRSLYHELENWPAFILTSRSKYIVDYTDMVLHSYRIIDYNQEDISILADKLLETTADITRFFDGLRQAKNVAFKNDLLKYPWLIIYMAEYFRDGANMDNSFFLSLPVEVFDSLTNKLIKSRRYSSDQIRPICSALGSLIIDIMGKYGEIPRTIEDGQLGANEVDLLEHLAELGAINVESTLSQKRNFRFNIPFLAETLAAYAIANLTEEKLRSAIAYVYYTPLFQQVLGYSILIRARQGNTLGPYFEEYDTPTGTNMENSYYGDLMSLQFLAYLPSGVFKPRGGFHPSRHIAIQYGMPNDPVERLGFILSSLPRYFGEYEQIVGEKNALFYDKMLPQKSNMVDSDYINYYSLGVQVVYFEKYFSIISTIIAKTPNYLEYETLISELLLRYKEDRTKLPSSLNEVLSALVPSKAFKDAVIKSFNDTSYSYITSFLLSVLIKSPYKNEELNAFLFEKLDNFRIKEKMTTRLFSIADTSPKTTLWQDHLDELDISILRLKQSASNHEDVISLLQFINTMSFIENKEATFFLSKFGEIRSVTFAEILALFTKKEFEKLSLSSGNISAYECFAPMTLLSKKVLSFKG